MKYIPPANTTPTEADPEPAYFNGNPTAGQKGAIPPAAAIEHPMREIMAVIQAAGLVPADNDLTQLLQAIAILAAGAGSTSAVFIYNPVFPEIISNGGLMSISAISGQVVIATGQQFIHRGGVVYNTSDTLVADRTFATVANKTYHLRWKYNGGTPIFVLNDLADLAYNPASKAETAVDFDTTYDDMLIARVVTNGANLPTVTALLNKARLTAAGEEGMFTATTFEDEKPPSQLTGPHGVTVNLNFARKPAAFLTGFTDATVQVSTTEAELNIVVQSLSRYQIKVIYQRSVIAGGAWIGYQALA